MPMAFAAGWKIPTDWPFWYAPPQETIRSVSSAKLAVDKLATPNVAATKANFLYMKKGFIIFSQKVPKYQPSLSTDSEMLKIKLG